MGTILDPSPWDAIVGAGLTGMLDSRGEKGPPGGQGWTSRAEVGSCTRSLSVTRREGRDKKEVTANPSFQFPGQPSPLQFLFLFFENLGTGLEK